MDQSPDTTTTSDLVKTLEGHNKLVTSVAFSPDSKFIASGSADNTIKIWDATTFNLIKTLEGHISVITSVAFSPDSKFIASGSPDKTIKIWDTTTYTLVKTLEGHTAGVTSVAFSPDAKFIASGSADKTIIIWDTTTLKLVKTLEGHTGFVRSVAFSPDSKFIASGSADNTIKIWDATTFNLIKTLEGHISVIKSVSFSPDSKFIASASFDKTIRIWDTSTFNLVNRLEGTAAVTSVSFSPDSKFIASGSYDKTIKIWDTTTLKLVKTLEGPTDLVLSVAFSPDSKFIASGSPDKTIKIWDTTAINPVKTTTEQPQYPSSYNSLSLIKYACMVQGATWDLLSQKNKTVLAKTIFNQNHPGARDVAEHIRVILNGSSRIPSGKKASKLPDAPWFLSEFVQTMAANFTISELQQKSTKIGVPATKISSSVSYLKNEDVTFESLKQICISSIKALAAHTEGKTLLVDLPQQEIDWINRIETFRYTLFGLLSVQLALVIRCDVNLLYSSQQAWLNKSNKTKKHITNQLSNQTPSSSSDQSDDNKSKKSKKSKQKKKKAPKFKDPVKSLAGLGLGHSLLFNYFLKIFSKENFTKFPDWTPDTAADFEYPTSIDKPLFLKHSLQENIIQVDTWSHSPDFDHWFSSKLFDAGNLSLGTEIKPPKGTRDFHPQEMALRRKCIRDIEDIFLRHGAVTIDTPVFELRSTLMGKYGEDSKLIYDLKDQGGEILSLRYDLTVPFARYCALNNVKKIKRYQIGKVYRRDKPSISQGRFREFYQCDLDICGEYATMAPEAELLKILCSILDTFATHIGKYKVKINHRGLLDAYLELSGVPTDDIRPICSAIDKLDKLSWDEVKTEMVKEKGLDPQIADKIKTFLASSDTMENPRTLIDQFKTKQLFSTSPSAVKALEELDLLFTFCEVYKITDRLIFDTSLARGLDYYTGVIYEAVLTGEPAPGAPEFKSVPKVGSIAAGGRYDGLIGMFSSSQVPAVGVSIGIERLFAVIEQNTDLQAIKATDTQVFVVAVDLQEKSALVAKLHVLNMLWNSNIAAETIQKATNKLKPQLAAASQARVKWTIFVDQEALDTGKYGIKHMDSRIQKSFSFKDILKVIQHGAFFENGNEATSESSTSTAS